MARFLQGVVESNRGESENKSVGSRRTISALGRGSEVFKTRLETSEGNLTGNSSLGDGNQCSLRGYRHVNSVSMKELTGALSFLMINSLFLNTSEGKDKRFK